VLRRSDYRDISRQVREAEEASRPAPRSSAQVIVDAHARDQELARMGEQAIRRAMDVAIARHAARSRKAA
jgi:hypothetical protein